MMHKLMTLIFIVMTGILTACGGGNGEEDTASSDENAAVPADTTDATSVTLDDPFPEADYQDFTLTHGITLCEEIVVPFAGTLTFSWDAGFDRCSMRFVSDDLAGRPEGEEDIDFRAHILPNDMNSIDDFGDRTQEQIIDFLASSYSSIVDRVSIADTETSINGRTAFRYEGLTLKTNPDDPDETQILHIIDFSTPDNPTYAVLSVRMLTADVEAMMPVVEEWVNSVGNETALENLVYVYDLPRLTIDLPTEAIATEPASFNLRFDDDPGDDPFFLSIITPSGDDNAPNLFQFTIPEIPPIDGKTYALVRESENTDQVGSLFRFFDGATTYFITPQDASVTASSDGYVLNIDVSGTFSLSGETPPIAGNFEFNLQFSSIPLPRS